MNNALSSRVDDARCVGTEDTLLHCQYDIFTGGCTHARDAGIRCGPGSELQLTNLKHCTTSRQL